MPFLAVLFFELEFFFAADFFLAEALFLSGGGAFLPSARASDRPIAIACFGLVTFFPLRPDLSLPFFIAFISRSTSAEALGLYFLPEPFFVEELFFAVAIVSASIQWEAEKHLQVAPLSVDRNQCRNLSDNSSRRQNLIYIYPVRRIAAGVARHAIGIPFATIACIL